MKFRIRLSLLLCFIVSSSQAQYYFSANGNYDRALSFEAGISIGPMNSLTDLGGRAGIGTKGPKDLNFKSTTLFGSIYGMVVYKYFLALRAEATAGTVKSNDSLLKGISVNNKAIGRYTRNLSFRSAIYEFSIIAEFHPLDLISNINTDREPPLFSPYLLAGVGIFNFNPQANLNGAWIDLHPLHTEGEGFAEYHNSKPYNLTQLNIPLGAGVAYQVSDKFNLRLEYIHRHLFTDYLDDVHGTYIDPAVFSRYLSGNDLINALILNNRVKPGTPANTTTARPGGKRGNPTNNDAYFTINFKVGYTFGQERGFTKRSKNTKRQTECPRFF
jgi:hypothetical protein